MKYLSQGILVVVLLRDQRQNNVLFSLAAHESNKNKNNCFLTLYSDMLLLKHD